MINYAIFDIDGTILDSSEMWRTLPARYLDRLGITPDPDICERLRPMTMREASEYLRERYSLTYSADEINRQITRMIENYYTEQVSLREGVPKLLMALRSRGVRMSAATSGDKTLAASALSRTGIAELFSGIASSEEYGAKTSPEVYFAAAEMICALPAETIVFEDSLYAVKTAKLAGFRTAAVRDISETDQDALKACSDLYELSPLGYCDRIAEILRL